MERKRIIFLLVFLVISFGGVSQDVMVINSKVPFAIGLSIDVHSKTLDENRILNIYLPRGYSTDSLKTYPVIYLLDGSIDEDIIHMSGLVQFCSFSWINLIPETIVVGIGNVDRKRDFTYPANNQTDQVDFPTSGGSEKFMDFIENEIQPFIEKKFRVSATRTLIGQSLGGLIATEMLFKKPDLFDNFIIVSPSLWWDDQSLLQWQPLDYDSKKSIYIAVGKEGEEMETLALKLFDKLTLVKRENTRLFFNFLEGQNHGDALHLAVYDSFEKIFKK